MLFNLPSAALAPEIAYVPDFMSCAEEAELVGQLGARSWSSGRRISLTFRTTILGV